MRDVRLSMVFSPDLRQNDAATNCRNEYSPLTKTQTRRDSRDGRRSCQTYRLYTLLTKAKTIADIIRSSLGPRAMLKMLLDPMGGIVLTNDGNGTSDLYICLVVDQFPFRPLLA
jgi:hypothetical protein